MEQVRQWLRAYRNELKGIAILWVVWFHMQLGWQGLGYQVQKIGYGGVDLFFFLSGFGLYGSLSQKPGLRDYWKRRARRLLPAYWPFCALWLAVMIPLRQMNLEETLHTVVGNGLMLGYFWGAPLMINWYVSALAASVLLAPLMTWALRRRPKEWPLWLALCFAVGLPLMGQNQLMAVSRLPVFFLGMVFALPVKRPEEKDVLALAAAALILGLAVLLGCFARFPEGLLHYGLYWYPFALIAPSLCVLLGRLMEKLPTKALAPLRMLGASSFEIFLWNVWLEWLFKKQWNIRGAIWWLLGGLTSIALGLAYHGLIQKMVSKSRKKA